MRHHHAKSFYLFACVATALTLAVFTSAFVWLNTREIIEPAFGITFSSLYARELGFAPEEMYAAMTDELGVKSVRLPIYWSQVEALQGVYQWEIPDRLVEMSQDRGVALTVVVGMKVPRWPECHMPTWAQVLAPEAAHEATLAFIRETVDRYADSSAIIRWQVENEPFFPYGECPTITPSQVQERVALVRELDDRPVQVTVSGELGSWLESARMADVLGISMYRQTWNDLFGYFVYPLTPEFYYLRASLVQGEVARVVVSELQAEPWFPEPRESRPVQEWYDAFTVEMLRERVDFARETGLSEAYLWGAEWWYALRQAGDDRLWEAAREIF